MQRTKEKGMWSPISRVGWVIKEEEKELHNGIELLPSYVGVFAYV